MDRSRLPLAVLRWPLAATEPACSVLLPVPRRHRAFTLIELLAVVLIILLLAGIVIGVSTWARLRAMRSRARSDIAVISLACESFRAEVGRYPTSTVYRMTLWPTYDYYGGAFELYNSSYLGSQLQAGGFLAARLEVRENGANSPFDACHTLTNPSVNVVIPTTYTNLQNVIMDPWERPYNYYCTYPVRPSAVSTDFALACVYQNYDGDPIDWTNRMSHSWVGGQVNVTSFDLWSYGQNMRSCPVESPSGVCADYNRDDIRNFED